MCRPTKQEHIADHYHADQEEVSIQTIMQQQQLELEHLIQIAENLKNDIIKLHDQEQALLERINQLKNSHTSLFDNIYSFISNRNVLLFVSGFLTGFYVLPAMSKLFSPTRV